MQNGIDTLLEDQNYLDLLKGKRVGLICNQASLTSQSRKELDCFPPRPALAGLAVAMTNLGSLRGAERRSNPKLIPSAYALHDRLGSSLTCLFTLEHGWSAFCAAGEKVSNSIEPHTKLPIYSLYGPLFEENVQRLEALDYLVIDIQDVGVRCYTYAATCAKVMEYASQNQLSLEVIICDRPNPLGNVTRGPLLDPAYRSLVGYIDVPFQHGKTIGELLKGHHQTVPLTVIPASDDFGALWIPPSPGLPDWESVFLYPGLVLLEGTNVSEGRGSTLPFKCVAAPGLDVPQLIKAIPKDGIVARPFTFTPTSGKLSGKECQGIQIHITDYQAVDGFALGVHILRALYQSYPAFEWVRHGEKYWIDLLTGSPALREDIIASQAQPF